MLQVIQHIYLIPLLLSMFLSLRAIKRKWPLPYRIFSCLLACVAVAELCSLLWKYMPVIFRSWRHSPNNLWIYNSFMLPQYLLYIAVYYNLSSSHAKKKLFLGAAVFLVCFFIFNTLVLQPIDTVESNVLILASAIVIYLVTVYFEELRKQKEVISLTSEPMVWISLGALIFHTASLPYMIALNFLNHLYLSLAVALYYIFMGLNFIMYSLYSIAFLCQPTSPKS